MGRAVDGAWLRIESVATGGRHATDALIWRWRLGSAKARRPFLRVDRKADGELIQGRGCRDVNTIRAALYPKGKSIVRGDDKKLNQ